MLLFLYSLLILQPTSSQAAAAAAAAAAAQCEIELGSTLSSTSSWLSPSGRFAFGFYPEEGGGGFNVGILFMESPNNKTVIWTAIIDDKLISVSGNTTTIKLVEEGLKLLHANSLGEDQAISSTGDNPAHCASMLDSGNFIIYDSDSKVLWQTFDYPTDTLIAGQELSLRQQLVSSISQTNHSEGRFRILMQRDGNLVMYPFGTDNNVDNAYWASNTYLSTYSSESSVILGKDGILFFSDGNQSRKNLTTGDSSYNPNSTLHLARLEPNGMLYVYAYDLLNNTSKVICKIPDNECDVKGICGFNSYCTFSEEKQVCLCLPDFDYLNTEDTHAGCQVKLIWNACPGMANDDTYNNTMDDLENIEWLKEPLSPLERLISKEGCRDSCLNDCSCQAAQYYGNDCWKQSLPLKFGRKDRGQNIRSTVTFIKIAKRKNISRGLDDAHQIVINKKEYRGVPLTVFVAVVSGLIIFIFVFVSLCLVGRNRMIRKSKELALADEIAPRSFSYHELYEATEGYKEEVGKGAFGTVFRGTLPSTGRSVAVKRLERVVEDGEREFQTEMKVIGRTHHRNLVRLLGYCNEGSNRLLVYEFMTNGSLADLIFKADQNRPHWKERLRIALDVGRGIHYLHEDCETHIIHCDIKPQNILMDEYWTAKISDFGLAKLLMPTQTRTFTGIRGTRGYLAPEWHKNMPITVKTDVYSFGIVLLEILCCRKNMELEVDADEIILSEWVYSCYLAGELEKLTLDEDVDMVEFEKAVKVGLWCIQTDPTLRPSMKNVIMMLEGCAEISSPLRP